MFTNRSLVGCTSGASRRIIAGTSDPQILGTFATFSRFPGVQRIASAKIASLAPPAPSAPSAPEAFPACVEGPDLQALADKYGEASAQDVLDLYSAKGSPEITAFCRTLSARRAARASKAKREAVR